MNTPQLVNANSLHIPLADESVDMVCTSPPYFNLRSYSTGDNKDKEIGSESVHDCLGWATGSPCGFCYICSLVTVFREVKRVLKDQGVLFLNLGDSYAGSGGAGGDYTAGGLRAGQPKWKNGKHSLPAKNLYGIPWRAALALQADGWILRSDIIWSKPNPMPESVTDRPTKAHEYVFMFSKQAQYFYDAEAIKEESLDPESYEGRRKRNAGNMNGTDPGNYKFHGSIQDDGTLKHGQVYPTRNRRSVWTVATQPYSSNDPDVDHFAAWPPALVEPMIKAGTSAAGCCPHCGKAWERVVEKFPSMKPVFGGKVNDSGIRLDDVRKKSGKLWREHKQNNPDRDLGFQPACACQRGEGWYWCEDCQITRHINELEHGCPQCGQTMTPAPFDPRPCTILDPFAGSGTSLLVARQLGRRAIGLDLSFAYLRKCARPRLSLDALENWTSGTAVKANAGRKKTTVTRSTQQPELF